ncbi:hypothetical protein FQA39_LY04638 [Lamprigera yunnana]|nr:hypothetical protein FQA39_LY04638 [Lamprigera yunnana]
MVKVELVIKVAASEGEEIDVQGRICVWLLHRKCSCQDQVKPYQYPTNNEVFGKKIESKPTPMSISSRNTNANYRPNFPRQQNVFQSNGPRNFKSEELFHINEGYNDSEPIQDDFEDRLVDFNEDLTEADENDESNYSESPVNFRIPASEELTST